MPRHLRKLAPLLRLAKHLAAKLVAVMEEVPVFTL